MIRFQGEITAKCMMYIQKQRKKHSFIAACIVTGILFVIFAALSFWNWNYIFSLINAPVFGVLVFILTYDNSKNCSNNIVIDSDEIGFDLGGKRCARTIQSVKKVVDFGGGYDIIFSSSHKTASCVCDKSLLTDGTIEQFEQLFADKMIKAD